MVNDGPEIEEMESVLLHYGRDVNLSQYWKTIRCPFHSNGFERNPSARATTSAFTCNSCDAKGDCYGLIMKVEDCDFLSAKQILEAIVGRSFGDVSKPATRKSWGVAPFSEGSGAGDDRELPTGVRGFPDLWG
jgi:hypothetical protein